MTNYRNYGNRRFSGTVDECGCNGANTTRGMQDRNYGRQEQGCGCRKAETDRTPDCGCKSKEEKKESDCGCMTETMYHEMKKGGTCCEEDMPGKALAMAYVPWQSFRKLYEICEGFSNGTIFQELNLDFCGRRCS